jgi:uncharacterized protein (TIGR00266 family)
MRHEILDRPDFALLRVTFDQPGETLVAESGAMVSMSAGIRLETAMRGGVLSAAKRKLLGGESLFQNTYHASQPGQEVLLAPPSEGDIQHRTLGPGEVFYLQSGCYVAHAGRELQLDTRWGGMKSFFSGVGLFMLKLTGPGEVWFASYGAIREYELSPPHTLIVDTGHIVGFGHGVEYDVKTFGGFKGLFFSGEGLIAHFRGHGRVYLQTRNPTSLVGFLEPFRPQKSSS